MAAIRELYAFIMDEPTGNEVLPGHTFLGCWWPAVADEEHLRSMRTHVESLLAEYASVGIERRVRMVRFQATEEFEEVMPGQERIIDSDQTTPL